MEHTGRQTTWKSGRFQSRPRSGTRLLHAALLFLFAFLVGRTPFLGEYFPAAIALTACLASRNPIYIYLAIPAGAGIFCCIRTGVDAWSELIAVIGCALLFAGVKKIHLDLWHRALIAGSVGILSLSIYRLATATVNKTGAGELLADGIMIAVFFFLWESLFSRFEGRAGRASFSCGADGGMDPGGLRNRSRISAVACGDFFDFERPLLWSDR